jgi:hypothetical protein
MMTRYKVARPDGWDFRTGETVNYRQAIGGVVEAPDWRKDGKCGGGLHHSPSPLLALAYGTIPCSLYIVEPVGARSPIDANKSKAQKLRVVEELTDLDTAFGFHYAEASEPIHPFRIAHGEITDADLELLRQWASVEASVGASIGDSVEASVGDSVWASVWDSVGDSVWASVWDSVGDSVWDSVRASVGASVWVSVWDSVGAYTGSLFPGVMRWHYADHEPGIYPFQPAVDLWHRGLVPSFNGKVWQLHAGENAEVVWEGVP